MDLLGYLEHQTATFDEEPFNAVDSAVLSQFCMVRSEGVAPRLRREQDGDSSRSPKMEALSDRLHALGTRPAHVIDYLDVRLFDGIFGGTDAGNVKQVVFLMASNPRFRDLEICDYEEVFDEETHTQFSAITLVYRDEWAYVGYRGTDGSITGWRENFDMAVNPPVQAQTLAVSYLDSVARHLPDRLYVGGHSKGGNLATYAALRCSKPVQDRIAQVFDHDGPGFKAGFIADGEFDVLEGRIHRTVPEESLVGQLMDTPALTRAIRSTVRGFQQHSIFTWLVNDDLRDFRYALGVSDSAIWMHRVLDDWIASMDDESLPRVVDALFRAVDASGLKSADELFSGNSNVLGLLIDTARNMDDETSEVLVPALTGLASIATQATTRDIRRPRWRS